MCGAVFGFIYRNGLNILSEFQINNLPKSTGKEMSDEQQGEIRAGFNCFIVAAYD